MKKTIFILTLLLPFGLLVAQYNNSDVDQKGNGNELVVSQTGNLNNSIVFTKGNGNAKSFVEQVGKGENDSKAVQKANGNTVDVYQDNSFIKPKDLNKSRIRQTGNNNDATVSQVLVNKQMFANGGKLRSNIKQTGNGNKANVDQLGLKVNAKILQDGNNSKANVYQGTSSLYTGKAFLSDAEINQGTNTKGNSLAEQHQVGLQNDAYINQDSKNGSKAVQVQINAKGQIMNARSFDVNNADITQSGGDNKAYQMQFFNNKGILANVANVVQDGKGNYSREIQIGGDNLSDVNQIGNNNSSDVYQNAHNVTAPNLMGGNPFGL
jgi:hypothetical protein